VSIERRLTLLEAHAKVHKVDLMAILKRVHAEMRADPEGFRRRRLEEARQRLSQPCPESGLERRIWEGLMRVYGHKLEVGG
jgi:hypothetical protein